MTTIKNIISILICLIPLGGITSAEPPAIGGSPIWSSYELNMTGTGMAWRDCDLDGNIDLFLSNGNDITRSPNTIYLSDGGWLPAQASWSSVNTEYSGHCAVGDVDDDGYPDFVVANYLGLNFGYTNRSDLYLNEGYLPSRYPSWTTPDSIYTFSCALGDVDNDGDLDLAFSTGEAYTSNPQQDLLYINDGGDFGDSAIWRSDDLTEGYDVYWGDVDNDGDLDLAITYESHPTAVYYNSGGMLETSPSWQAATDESGNTLVFGDVNGDGWLDLVVAYNNQQNGEGRFRVYFNNGAGQLSSTHGWESATGGYGSALALYDYDGDGDDDLAAGRWFTKLFIYENTGSTFTTSPVWYSDFSMVAEDLAWVDMDGQGVMDYEQIIPAQGDRKLFYLQHHPLYAIDSIVSDGNVLGHPDFCYDLTSGWVSLASAPITEIAVHYRYSAYNDLAVVNWDTFAMVFPNIVQPLAQYQADTVFGWAPLTVQFTDETPGATDWLWNFGDGGSSTDQHPAHIYSEGGIYDVSLEASTPDGTARRISSGMIRVLGDSLRYTGKVTWPPGAVTLPVRLKNTQQISTIYLPVSYAGDLNVNYTGWNLDGCRTDYFQDVMLVAIDATKRKLLFRLQTGNTMPLQPGEGPILNVEFYQNGTGSVTLDTATVSSYKLSLETTSRTYVPRVIPAHMYQGICGNVDGSSDGQVDIADLTALILYLFLTYEPPVFFDHANIDGSEDGLVDIGDLNHMILYLFIQGPPPVCP